jgi:hypothetical protein
MQNEKTKTFNFLENEITTIFFNATGPKLTVIEWIAATVLNCLPVKNINNFLIQNIVNN